jgi:hypothetical protein
MNTDKKNKIAVLRFPLQEAVTLIQAGDTSLATEILSLIHVRIHGGFKKQVTKNSNFDNFILTSMYTSPLGSTWNTSDLR